MHAPLRAPGDVRVEVFPVAFQFQGRYFPRSSESHLARGATRERSPKTMWKLRRKEAPARAGVLCARTLPKRGVFRCRARANRRPRVSARTCSEAFEAAKATGNRRASGVMGPLRWDLAVFFLFFLSFFFFLRGPEPIIWTPRVWGCLWWSLNAIAVAGTYVVGFSAGRIPHSLESRACPSPPAFVFS